MKLKELRSSMADKGIDAVILFSGDASFFYFLQRQIEGSALLIPKKEKPVIFISPIENIKTSFRKIVFGKPADDIEKELKRLGVKQLGINESNINVRRKKSLSKLVKTKDVSEILDELRLTKLGEETDKIRKACYLTEKIFNSIVKGFPYKKEGDIKKHMKIEAVKHGCELSFEPIVASGKGASTPHYTGNRKLKKGFLVIDMGLKYQGYCADITRTLYLGKPSGSELELYNFILSVQKKTLRKIKAGVKARDLDLFARKELGEKAKYFVHGLGHGLGLDVHEKPRLSKDSTEELAEGMVVTVEPGYYKGLGIRIEDDVLVTRKGCRLLNRFPKELVIIPNF